MIVCHCNSITEHDIHTAMEWMRASDPDTIITPGKVYRALGKKADCGGCLPIFMDTMEQSKSLEAAGGPPRLVTRKQRRVQP